LLQFIEATYHGYLRLSLPILTTLVDEIVCQHPGPLALAESLRHQFAALEDHLELHLARQEHRLFPAICHLREPVGETAWITQPTDNVDELIDRFIREDRDALDVLRRVRECLRDMSCPPRSRSLEQLTVDLDELQQSLEQHFQLEHEVLFPAVRELVRSQSLAV
jgi:iron-sulfur cluster repair protein YtfE (RIC family)